jgi:ABC-type sulfate transport system permease component
MRYSKLFSAFLYAITITFLLGVCWLFVSNTGHTDLHSIRLLAQSAWFRGSLKLSLATSFLSTAIAVLIGVPAAYALSRFKVPGKTAIDIVFSSVIVLPASTIGLCLMVAFQWEPVLKIQQALGFRVVHSLSSVVIAQLVLALALGIKAWKSAFDDLDPRIEQVARTLGGGRRYTFFKVTLPSIRTGLLTGIILAWTRAMAEFGAVLLFSSTFRERDASQFSAMTRFLGLDRADILPVGMWLEIEGGEIERGIAIAFVLVVITFFSVFAMNCITGKGLFRTGLYD